LIGIIVRDRRNARKVTEVIAGIILL
jgi:hypothetical protein